MLLKINKLSSFAVTFVISNLFLSFASAQTGNDPVGSRSNAMGGYSVTLSDAWSNHNNQAGLGFVKNISGGIYYENRFLLSETSYKAGTFILPVKIGAIALSLSSFGFSQFNETNLGLSYGQRFGDNFFGRSSNELYQL